MNNDRPRPVRFRPMRKISSGRDERGIWEDWENDRYGVTRRIDEHQEWLMIARLDGSAERDWRDYQRIKNQIFGSEVEAVELYPAESRLIDPSNAFFLWRLRGDARRIGLFGPRFVAEPDVYGLGPAGAPQRASK